MDYSKLLNSEQYEAMLATDGPVLVSAGAGSGKTRLLTYRIAYLITEKHVPPQNILAITFTNKAANEMKERIHDVAPGGELVTVCTFHSFCARMLRMYASFIPGYKENFTIFSETDTAKIYKDIFKQLNITDETTKCNFKHNVSTIKNENMTIEEYKKIFSYDRDLPEFERFYLMYQDELKKNNAMDFDDLLVNFYKLISTNQNVLASIQNKYTYFSVDEFQDTNKLQYDIIKLLASKTRNLLIVGDEDQSIYGWRGANIDNIFNFTREFKDVKIFKLEQNYRSTKKILERANKIIKNNKNRLDKNLYTENEEGTDVYYYPAMTETDEADFVVRTILSKHNEGVPYHEMAILMRLNALSRAFEEKLLAYNVPHIMYNGFKFFERAEIKNVLAYLTQIVNPDDNVSFTRIINFPKRGIGDTSIEKLNQIAISTRSSLKQVVMNYELYDLPSSLRSKLKDFKALLTDLDEKINEYGMYDFFTYLLDEAGIMKSFDLENEQDLERSLNVNSLANSVKEFEENNEGATIIDYLQSVTLSAAMDDDDGNGVVIATVHGAKGLEFDTVFVVGCEEKIFPISRDNNDDIEEERRLMYVAITRAKKDLYLTSSDSRFMYGKREYSVKSRFLRELDLVVDRQIKHNNFSYNNQNRFNSYNQNNYSYNQNYSNFSNQNSNSNVNKFNYGGNMTTTLHSNNNQSFNYTFSKSTIEKKDIDFSKIKVGAKVTHPKFGDGVISEVVPNSSNHTVKIKFDVVGEKMLSLDYAPIEFKD
ncbi:MAG TPA: UvrD-helicase domain-containing protein [Candidatus Onthoplasma faecipullorum]|nr:UvrD-helicase domain-containing protein [Candidatus Onthoplasma faecipullorum]